MERVEVEVALREKERAKRAQKAAAQLSPPATPITLVQGSGHFRMTTTAWVVIGVFSAAFIFALTRGVIIVPGLLLIFGLWSSIRPGRDLVVTDQGLAIFHRSWVSGRPSKPLAVLPPAPIFAASASGSVELQFGAERITLKRPEYDRLAAAMGSFTAGPPVPGTMAPPVAPASAAWAAAPAAEPNPFAAANPGTAPHPAAAPAPRPASDAGFGAGFGAGWDPPRDDRRP